MSRILERTTARLDIDSNTSSFLHLVNVSDLEFDDVIVDPISDSQFFTFVDVCLYVLSTLGIAGTVANCLNIVVFVKMGLHSNSTIVTFLSLSVMDLGVTLFASTTGFAIFFAHVEDKLDFFFSFRPLQYIVYAFSINAATAFVGGSILMTTFLAVQRCCCVAFPFQFRRVFTNTFIGCVIGVVSFVTLLVHVACISMYTAGWKQVPGQNFSAFTLVARPYRRIVIHYLSIINLFVLTIGCEAIVLFCLVVMVIGLRRSARFRGKSTRQSPTDDDSVHVESTSGSGTGSDAAKDSHQQADSRAVKTVILISALFVLCNSPAVFLALLRIFFDEFDTFGQLRNSNLVAYYMTCLFNVLNSSLNIFIYFKSNAKFRSTLKTVLVFL